MGSWNLMIHGISDLMKYCRFQLDSMSFMFKKAFIFYPLYSCKGNNF